jgi:hypothetical protein
MPLPVDAARPPPFHQWNQSPKRFEAMAAVLLDLDERFQDGDAFGLGGQRQWGVDALALRRDGGGRVVQSCKCYVKVKPAELKAWSDEFLVHASGYWAQRNITQFILATAAENVTDAKVRDQIEAEVQRFAALGIAYEIWGPEQLYRRLLHSRTTIQRFLGPGWADLTLGPETSVTALSAALVAQLARAQSDLSNLVVAQVRASFRALRAEAFEEVDAVLAATQGEIWDQLTPAARSEVLGLAGELALAKGDRPLATARAEAARALNPQNRRLAALLAGADDPRAGLKTLGETVERRDRQVQAALCIEAGELTQAEALLAALRAEAAADPEDARLEAHLHLAKGRWRRALEVAETALARAPDWPRNVEVLAIARYAIGFSPATPAEVVLGFAATPWSLIKTDRISLQARALAAATFATLSTRAGATQDRRLAQLACLASHPDHQEEAAALVAVLLGEDPAAVDVVDWALSRSYPIDPQPCRAALRARLVLPNANAEDVGVYAVLLARAGLDATEATQELENLLAELSPDPREAALTWIARINGQAPANDIVLPRETITAAIGAAEREDPAAIEALLRETLGGEVPSVAGVNVADQVSQRGWSTLIVPYVDTLVAFETLGPLTLAAVTLHNTATPQRVLDLISQTKPAYSKHHWPRVLRRIEIDALSRANQLPAANTLAEKLLAESGAHEDRRLLARLKINAGDTTAAAPLVRRLLRDGELPAAHAVQFSQALTRQDRSLARDLLRDALQRGVPDHLVLTALGQAFKLGLDKDAGGLVTRLNTLAAQDGAGVWRADVEDLPQILANQSQAIGETAELLMDGAIVRHVAASTLKGALGPLDIRSIAEHREPLQAVFLRHGGRSPSMAPPGAIGDWRFLLDVSGLLSAHALDLLDLLETASAGPIGISPRLVQVLYALENEATHQQVARIEAGEAIIAAHAATSLRLVDDFSEEQTVRHARDRLSTSQPGPTLEALRNLLVRIGAVDPPEASAEPPDLVRAPVLGQTLVFVGNTLEVLTREDALAALVSRFDCVMPRAHYDRLVAEVATSKAGDVTADALATLRERIAQGLQTGLYVFVDDAELNPSTEEAGASSEGAAQQADDPGPETALEASLVDIISGSAGSKALAWIDDRHVSGYVGTGRAWVVGAVEVLNLLVTSGKLTLDQRREKLLALRRSGAVFIPMTADEVLAPLLAAPIVDDVLMETPALETLRRSLALGLALDPHLHLGDSEHETLRDRPHEIPFLQTSRRVVIEGLDAIWRRPNSSPEDCRARSDWLWSALRLERAVRVLSGDEAGVGNLLLASLLVAGCLAAPANWVFENSLVRTIERQALYLDWALSTMWAPREGLDEAFADQVASQTRAILAAPFERDLNPPERNIAVRLRQEVLACYPKELRRRILADDAFAETVGVKLATTLTVGEKSFASNAFWSGAARALRAGTARVVADTGKRVTLRRDGEDLVVETAPHVRLREIYFDLLVLDARARRQGAALRLDTLSLTPSDLQALKDRAADLRTEGELAVLFDEAERLDPGDYYARMAQTFGTQDGYPVSFFRPPRADRLLHAMGLSGKVGPWPERISKAWTELAAERDALFAFTQLAGLPVDLASCAVQTDLDVSALSAPGSPMARLHLAAIAERRGLTKNPQLDTLLKTVRSEGYLFAVLLGWSQRAFQADATWRAMEPGEQLALIWTHAHRLTTLLTAKSDEPRALADLFLKYDPGRSLGEVLSESRILASDCAWPAILQPPTIVCHGLAYIFGQTPVWPRLNAENQVALGAMMTDIRGDDVRPTPAVFNRTVLARNALESWLVDWPAELLEDDWAPETYRNTQIDKVLDDLAADSSDGEIWSLLTDIGRPSLNPAQRDRLEAIFEPLELWRLRCAKDSAAPNFSAPVAARLRLGGAIETSWLLGKLNALATAAAKAHPGPVTLTDLRPAASPSPRGEVFLAVAEVMGAIARGEGGSEALERLHDAAMALASGWPAAVPALRELFDRFVRQTPPRDLAPVWRALVTLRRST